MRARREEAQQMENAGHGTCSVLILGKRQMETLLWDGVRTILRQIGPQYKPIRAAEPLWPIYTNTKLKVIAIHIIILLSC